MSTGMVISPLLSPYTTIQGPGAIPVNVAIRNLTGINLGDGGARDETPAG